MRLPVSNLQSRAWRGAFLLVTTVFLAASGNAQPREAQPREVEEILIIGEAALGVLDASEADSVIAFSEEDLAAFGAQDISDLADFTPNLEIVNSGATTPTFFIRGVGLNDFNSNSTGAVAIYQDGIAINAPAMQLSKLYDIEGVSVLRGPQGVGMNRNASAGAIRIRSKRPSGNVGGYLRADFGNFDYMDYEGAVETPIFSDHLSTRIAFRFSQRDGFLENRCGSAPALGSRIPFDGSSGQLGTGPWSICGETLFGIAGDISSIPLGLEDDVNDLNNWAGRVTFALDPDLESLPMSWTFNVHMSQRSEFSRLGQTFGTGGTFCVGGAFCTPPFLGVPAAERGRTVSGLLGGRQGRTSNGYRSRDVLQALGRLSPCSTNISPTGVFGTCGRLAPGKSLAERRAEVEQENQAKIALARQLARNLDDFPYEGDFNHTGKTRNRVIGGFLTGDIDIGSSVTLNSRTGIDAYDRSIDLDADFSPETLFHVAIDDRGYQIYQDLTLDGELGGEGGRLPMKNPLLWKFGGWFHYEDLDVEVNNDLGRDQVIGVGSRAYEQRTFSLGASADVSFDFWDDFTLSGGFRYNWDNKDLDYVLIGGAGSGGAEFTQLDDVWQAMTGTIRLEYRFREDTRVFWKYTRGWKPGTYNATSGQGRPVSIAQPEDIDSFEAGFSGAWFDDLIAMNGSLFYYAYSDYQIFTTQQFLGGNTEFVTLNANDAEVYGAELDTFLRPTEGTELGMRFSWLESQFLDFVQVNQGLTSGGPFFGEAQNSSNQLLNSPRFKLIFSATQDFPLPRDMGDIVVRFDSVWTDDVFFDASEGRGAPNLLGEQILPDLTIGQRAYWLHNLRIGWRSIDGQIELAGWVRNLDDKVYKTFAFDASQFQNFTVHYTGDPRTYGLSIKYTY